MKIEEMWDEYIEESKDVLSDVGRLDADRPKEPK